jgi:tetraacyldisaccharide 4'-kinase
MKILLYPFSLIYGFITWLRNKFFDWGFLKQTSFRIPIISVGNITVGGTGKTPFIEFLIRSLSNRYQIAVLSRGYKRNTHGVVVANERATAAIIGDEPAQILHKFPNVTVAVAEERVAGINTLLKIQNAPEMILLDDAFQHRHVKPGFSILLVDFNRPMWKDTVMPAGRLREYACGSKRANLFVVTKCPDSITNAQKMEFIEKIRGANEENTFFTKVGYSCPKSLDGAYQTDFFEKHQTFTVVTGIAKAEPFMNYLSERGTVSKHFEYADHHHFTQHDIDTFKATKSVIVTTEKDATRLQQWSSELDIVYIPIETEFFENQDKQFVFLLYKYLVNA